MPHGAWTRVSGSQRQHAWHELTKCPWHSSDPFVIHSLTLRATCRLCVHSKPREAPALGLCHSPPWTQDTSSSWTMAARTNGSSWPSKATAGTSQQASCITEDSPCTALSSFKTFNHIFNSLCANHLWGHMWLTFPIQAVWFNPTYFIPSNLPGKQNQHNFLGNANCAKLTEMN